MPLMCAGATTRSGILYSSSCDDQADAARQTPHRAADDKAHTPARLRARRLTRDASAGVAAHLILGSHDFVCGDSWRKKGRTAARQLAMRARARAAWRPRRREIGGSEATV